VTGTLEGCSAIVTGAGRGIGRAIAEVLAAQGARVIVADAGLSTSGDGADPTFAREVATAINDKRGGNNALAFTESVASPGTARQLVDLALRTFDRIDIVVNNAAIRRDAPVFEADPADWDAVVRNNLSAPFYLTQAATAIMRRRGTAGRIVNIVSEAGLSGAAGQAAYASAKAGLIGLTRATAMDLADTTITANAVLPFDSETAPDLVTALCTAAAQGITGQVLGLRGREVFRFDSPSETPAADLTRMICNAP
jgi:NAD(P)-dependent dehydrogenase (short-subunit alcohol dehydrogenase family)